MALNHSRVRQAARGSPSQGPSCTQRPSRPRPRVSSLSQPRHRQPAQGLWPLRHTGAIGARHCPDVN
eukprot:13360537-Alexandrium_andersonii.AAC.1